MANRRAWLLRRRAPGGRDWALAYDRISDFDSRVMLASKLLPEAKDFFPSGEDWTLANAIAAFGTEVDAVADKAELSRREASLNSKQR